VQSTISSYGARSGWDFPRDAPKAEVPFSKSFIQLLLAGYRDEHFFDAWLSRKKSLPCLRGQALIFDISVSLRFEGSGVSFLIFQCLRGQALIFDISVSLRFEGSGVSFLIFQQSIWISRISVFNKAMDGEFVVMEQSKKRWNFPDNRPKAEVPFSQISIHFFSAGL
jgi:hypothetical protein